MKKEKVGITILILFITITTSINIVSLNKSSKLLGTVPSRNIDSNEVDYIENKSVQGAINDLAEKANIIGTDEEKNKFRDDSKTIIGQIGTDKLTTTSQNLIGAINELNESPDSGNATCTKYTYCAVSDSISWVRYGKLVIVNFYNIHVKDLPETSGKYPMAEDLPKAKYWAGTSFSPSVKTSTGCAYRVSISANTRIINWDYTASCDINAFGQLIYITE